MSAPTADPIILQILGALVGALGFISQAHGFYNDIAGVGIEPLAFTTADTFPQIVVAEESNKVTDANGNGTQRAAVIAAHGFLRIDPATAYAAAHRLRADIERVFDSISAKTFVSAATGKQLVNNWSKGDESEVAPAESLGDGFLEVIVRVSVVYRNFNPPVQGI